ncbi:hypothetical protein LO80_08060 [Candidatus Francisella endociliophora]|uniref:DUF4124 domain-containing protein n=1 Tax=Candidatus Francisella endociliophora TaxID=653937 RepID=A0A097EQS8_9GAMM|nr:DUF4124 domain-containing protein [Francisella sp. FSC1006]AIT09925.1 hypothetical protein LO80_08060 [Francisella sp. FSC1006]
MSKINKTFLSTLLCFFAASSIAEAAETQVYSWRSENGSVVFSEEKPTHDVEYKTLEVGKPTVVDTKAPKKPEDGSPVQIGQSDVEKLANSQLADKNKEVLEEGQQTNLEVQITSPANDANIFTKEDGIPITTSPTIPKDDNPTFIINGSTVPATYDGTNWTIARPTPGENKLSIGGHTADGGEIKSSNQITFYIKNGWLQQSKNTGNYRKG